ncbi:MAG: peptidoglycan -binding protein [Chromatiales bacterium]|nr:peptidoglycan -binding protein [Chromatiales bacterium]
MLDIWPGYVDALAALLMVVIFILMIFTLAQFFLSQTLDTRDQELQQLNERLAEINRLLGVETDKNAALASELDEVGSLVSSLTDERYELFGQIETLEKRGAEAEAELARRQARIRELAARSFRAEYATDQERSLAGQARDQIGRLSQRIEALRGQLAEISAALKLAEADKTQQQAQIEDLGKRLNLALARKVNQLEEYRSEFFGRLRALLDKDPNIRVVGDRFVFQSELLFASGSAELGEAGKAQLRRLSETLKELGDKIPADIDWVLQVDGHTDRVPIKTAAFADNWDLAAARARAVVLHLADLGIPRRRLAAASFGEFQPLDPADTPAAYQRNRRIELKLTDR